MSDAPTPDQADAVPSAEELRRTAVPAEIRHAPRVGRMIGTGVWIGIVLGIVLGAVLPNSTGVGRGIVILLLSLGFALLFGLIAGVIATRMDKPLPHRTDGPLFPQDAVVTEQVDTREAAADAAAGEDAPAPTERSNGDTT